MVQVFNKDHQLIKCRALLDTCSTANFISEQLVRKLKLPMRPCSLPIGAINSMNAVSKYIVNVTFQSLHNNYQRSLSFLTIPKIADFIPSETFPRNCIQIPSNIKLADPEFHIPRPIELLIGSGPSLSMFSVGQINISQGHDDLYLQKTLLGWIIVGGISGNKSINNSCHVTNLSLENQIAKFWETEEISTDHSRSREDNECEEYYRKTVRRDDTGRYVVRLPFRNANKDLGNSRSIALKRFYSFERKCASDHNLKSEYNKIMQEYIDLGHMSLVHNPNNDGYYMPHHAVIKESSATTKVRVVFDASAKSDTDVSLNDILMVGPTIQDKIFIHLIRFRLYEYVMTADIEKMYRQVKLHEDDRVYQKIFWRVNNEIREFQLNTVTFGVTSSPFLAIRTIHQLVEDERESYPKSADVLLRDLYVDDLLTGTNNIEDAKRLRDDIISLLARGHFNIRQWASNDKRILEGLSENNINSRFMLNKDNKLKTLGVSWNARDDKLYYSVKPINSNLKYTKRSILSEIAKIFDPLGLLGPIILYAKTIMQNLWKCKVDWDESVPAEIHTTWSTFIEQLNLIDEINFERKLLIDNCKNVQVHGFCDASQIGYGACIYLRSSNHKSECLTSLVCAKSRVASLKSVTIPRLELCSARLLSALLQETMRGLNISPDKIVLWSDSTIVLHWIKTSPHLLKTYVANRVSEIQDLTRNAIWRHVSSEDNPADCLSRGQLPSAFCKNSLWFKGPTWLRMKENYWPNTLQTLEKIPETKKTTCLISTIDLNLFQRYSSYSKLLRIMAYCLRFRKPYTYRKPLSIDEINEVEKRIIKVIQSYEFKDILNEISKYNSTKNSRLATLNPFIDDYGLLRVGGRLQNSSLRFSQKHPILLPKNNFLTDLIIKEIHNRYYHSGITTTLYTLRGKFWVLDGKNQVRKIIRHCNRCFRFNAESVNYKMGNLPSVRVNNARPFQYTGVDFCGPFFIKKTKHRNKDKIKIYVCIFICMVIKAVHLEVVSDLTTEGFLGALRRFTARRGIPTDVYSDNGTNFVGANNQLKELYALFNTDKHKSGVRGFALSKFINWHFIPPSAPHFGGLWEANIRIFKHHLKRVVGDTLFTYEEFTTFITEIEGILNSRPLTSLSSDPNDLLVLTPAHYLIGEPLNSIAERDFMSIPSNRLSAWQHITKVRQDFWKRWNKEYLNELQGRNKWTTDGVNLKVNTVVLVKNKLAPCMQWQLGRVTEVIPGKDGVIRVVKIKTALGEMKRPVNLLCPLPIIDNEKQ